MSVLADWLAKFASDPTSDKIKNSSSVPGVTVTDALDAAAGGSFDASNVAVTPAGGIVATDVQAALVELDSELSGIVTVGSLTWQVRNSSFSPDVNTYNIVIATTGAVEVTQPTFSPGQFITIYNDIDSTETVRVLNPSNTIDGPAGTVSPGDDLVIPAGDKVTLVARTTTLIKAI